MAKGADCKSAVLRLRRFESFFPHQPSLAKRREGCRAEALGRRRAVAASYGSASQPALSSEGCLGVARRAKPGRGTPSDPPSSLGCRTYDGATPSLERGSLIRKIAPPSRRFSADIRPWCASTIVRAIDRPIPIPSALLVKNGSKTSFRFVFGNARTAIRHGKLGKVLDARSPDADDALFARRVPHRVDPVHDKVQNDLLKLDAVAEDRKRIRRDHANHFDFSANGQRRKKFDGVSNKVIEVEVFQFERRLLQQAAHSSNNLAGPPVILQNIFHDIPEFSDVGLRRLQDRVCGFGVGQNRAERLVDFVSDRGCQFTGGREAVDMGKLAMRCRACTSAVCRRRCSLQQDRD